MAYTRKTWVNGDTPLSAENMNNIEAGIETLDTTIGTIYTNSRTEVRNVVATEITSLLSMTLPAGTYVVTAHSVWEAIKAGRTFIAIGTSIAGGDSMDSAQ